MKYKTIIVLSMFCFVFLYAFQAHASFWSKHAKQEQEKYISAKLEESSQEIPDKVLADNEKQQALDESKKALEQHKNKIKVKTRVSMRYCLDECKLNKDEIAACHKKNKENNTEDKCIPDDQKQCLMSCVDRQVMNIDIKGHQACFSRCEINQSTLATCRQEYKEKGLDPNGKCLSGDKQKCIKQCHKKAR